MTKFAFTAILLLWLVKIAAAQTSLTIIGTAHQKTNNFGPDDILKALNKIQPDVILLELDTSLMDDKGNYKGAAIKSTENEKTATEAYRQVNPNLIVRRFDLEDRNAYYTRNKTFAKERQLGHALDSMYNNKLFDEQSKLMVDTLFGLYQADNRMSQMDINALNSKEYQDLAARKQYWIYTKELDLVANVPELKQYYDFCKEEGDFWIRRNKRMTENILNYMKLFKGKKLVVLTGSTHKYILTDYLKPLQTKAHFKLNDLEKVN